MPDVTEMLQANPEMFQGQGPEQSAAVPVFGGIPINETPPSWQQLRNTRASRAMLDPGIQDELAAHHNALADAGAYDQVSAHNLAAYHAAKTMHDTAAFHQAVHGLDPTTPDAEHQLMELGRRLPFAKPDAELMRPWYEARKQYLDANGAVAQMKEQQANQKFITSALAAGHLSKADFNDPQFRDEQGNISVPRLQLAAALRASGQMPGGVVQPKLSPEENTEYKEYIKNPADYTSKILNSTDDAKDKNYNSVTAARKATFYSGMGKMAPKPAQAQPNQPQSGAVPQDVRNLLGF